MNEFEARIQLHCLWDKEDLEYIEQTLSKPLLIDKVACFNFCQVLVISAALFAEFLYVGSEDLIPCLRLFVSFISKFLAH